MGRSLRIEPIFQGIEKTVHIGVFNRSSLHRNWSKIINLTGDNGLAVAVEYISYHFNSSQFSLGKHSFQRSKRVKVAA